MPVETLERQSSRHAPVPGYLPLLYHELRTEPAAYSYALSCARFQAQLELMRSLPETSYAPVVTFDDGHLSNYTHALPLLEQAGVKAHFFITAGWTGTRSEYMTPAQIRAVHKAGHSIGGHGWTHTLLTQCSAAELRHELRDARSLLEDHISAPVTSLSLPGGRSNAGVLEACREAGYTTVWTSVPESSRSLNALEVGRFNILAGHTDEFLRKLLDPASGQLARVRRVSRIKSLGQRVLGDRLYARLWAMVNRQEGEQKTEPGDPSTENVVSRGEVR